MGLRWGMLWRRTKNNGDKIEDKPRKLESWKLWLCEKELEKWFRDHPERRLPQSFKKHLISKYDLPDSDVLLASKRVRRRLQT